MNDSQNYLDALVGKTIRGLSVSDDEHILVFHCESEDVIYETDGDCCSETWFADIVGLSFMLNESVLHAHDIFLPAAADNRTRQDKDEFYGVTVTTVKGTTTIVYRNSSNGYYGGGIHQLSELPTSVTLRPILEVWEWSA